MDPTSPSPDFSWLAMTPVNRVFDDVVMAHRPVVAIIVLLVILCFVVSRVLVRPPLPQRFPRLVWMIDVVVVPLTLMAAGSLIERTAHAAGWINTSIYVDLVVTVLTYLSWAWLTGRGLELFFWQGLVEARSGYKVPILVRGLSYAILLLLAISFIFWRSGYSPTGVLISTGVFAAILGLALQSTISDFFSGVALSVEQPYGIGDWIELDDGTLGEVIEVSWRSTQLLSFNHGILTVPNSRLANQRIHNYTRPDPAHAVWYEMKLPAEIEPTTAKRILTDAVTRCRYVMHNPPPTIRLADASTIPYTYMVYVHFTNFLAMFPGRDALFREIDAEFRRMGVRPAAESQELFMTRRGDVHLQPASVASALRAVDLLTVLDHDQINELAGSAVFETVEAGTEVMTQGEPADGIYIVWSGLLRAHFVNQRGNQVEVEELEAGESFGQISVVINEPALVTVIAMTETVLIRLEQQALRPLIEAKPDLAQRFAKVVADRLKSVSRAQAARDAREESALPRNVAEIKRRLEGVFFGDHRSKS